MRKYLTVFASFVIMLCIGSVYAWSLIASELIEDYGFSASQSQMIFGTLIAVFPATMIIVGHLGDRVKYNRLGYISGILFLSGYIVAGLSRGNFLLILTGIGIFGGIATGFGYWVALTSPVRWFPHKKGLITGIAAAGFGLGAVFMSDISESILENGKDVMQLLKIVGLTYGLAIVLVSNLFFRTVNSSGTGEESFNKLNLRNSGIFRKLILGIFLGTFAGLLIIGSLKLIGEQGNIPAHTLVLGISFFAFANFSGRLVWGVLSDFMGANLGIFLALLFQAAAIFMLNIIVLSDTSYLILSSLIGFGFGGNFVLFAKETAQEFGVENLGVIYPYVFLGYAIAGIAGPISGGYLFDYTGSFSYSISLASVMSLAGSILFLKQYITSGK